MSQMKQDTTSMDDVCRGKIAVSNLDKEVGFFEAKLFNMSRERGGH